MDMEKLREEMESFYAPLRTAAIRGNADFVARRDALWAEMDAFALANPSLSAPRLKARLQERIARSFEPQLFPHSPFFFEMGARPSENWGTPSFDLASWLLDRRGVETEPLRKIRELSNGERPWRLWLIWNAFDTDHHCLNYGKLLANGVEGVMAEIDARASDESLSPGQREFLEAAKLGCESLLLAARRFAEKAEKLLESERDAQARKFLSMIASAARHVPAKPPRDFYEGLAALLFLREATASFEAIGISVLGHVDRLLGGLLKRDLLEGVLSREEAKDLLARWMLHTDVKFHVEDNGWPETSTCVELGGCDADGKPVFNEATRLLIEAHAEGGLLNPKLNCRYSKDSPEEYLALLAKHAAKGHNNFAFLNDDVLVPACVKAGKSLREARLYVNGGCQETIVEGVEHSAGAYYYFNMARLFDIYLRPVEGAALEGPAAELLPEAMKKRPEDFESLYEGFVKALEKAVARGAGWLREAGARWAEIHPCPLFSSSLEGCLEKAADYAGGAAKYNPAGIALVGMSSVADSLLAIKKAVYEEKLLSFEKLEDALKRNWKGTEPLRLKMAAMPKFGHGEDEADELAARLAKDIVDFIKPLRNERGGPFQPSFFVYYMYVRMGESVRATPDGRRDGELLNQGISPGRVRPEPSLTNAMRSLSKLDLSDFPGNAVLDVQLPRMPEGGGRLEALLRSFAKLGGMTLQPNCVSLEEMRDAQANPEAHKGLIVRISGLSAKFVALSKPIQEEIISRAMMR